MYYLKIRKDFFKTIKDPKELLVLYYLFIQENKEGYINFSIKDLIEYWNYKPKRNEDKINQTFKNILMKFKEKSIILTDINFIDISISTKIHITFSQKNNIPWYFNETESFITLSIKELNILRQYINTTKEKVQIEKILFLYLTIKSYMNFSLQNITYCFPTLETLVKFCGFSKSTIYKYINILKDCNMIYTYTLGNFIDTNENTIPVPTVYSLNNIEITTLKNNLSAYLYRFKEWEIVI